MIGLFVALLFSWHSVRYTPELCFVLCVTFSLNMWIWLMRVFCYFNMSRSCFALVPCVLMQVLRYFLDVTIWCMPVSVTASTWRMLVWNYSAPSPPSRHWICQAVIYKIKEWQHLVTTRGSVTSHWLNAQISLTLVCRCVYRKHHPPVGGGGWGARVGVGVEYLPINVSCGLLEQKLANLQEQTMSIFLKPNPAS